ncbi:hypothetical protein ABZY81_38420 [Streptomyces sp. NPDC006514]|uniref:hypothetical protein n=1 Tax=Streptomyces sp. NPDC006514 TaxID=3154308 RepID=UPI0033A660A0
MDQVDTGNEASVYWAAYSSLGGTMVMTSISTGGIGSLTRWVRVAGGPRPTARDGYGPGLLRRRGIVVGLPCSPVDAGFGECGELFGVESFAALALVGDPDSGAVFGGVGEPFDDGSPRQAALPRDVLREGLDAISRFWGTGVGASRVLARCCWSVVVSGCGVTFVDVRDRCGIAVVGVPRAWGDAVSVS